MAADRLATTDELARLLALFPVTDIKRAWPEVKADDKKSLCALVAAELPEQILDFVDAHFGACKQHVYLFEREGAKARPQTLGGGTRVKNAPRGALYIVQAVTEVVLLDPYEDASIRFLWPIRLETIEDRVALRFVVLEKNVPSYFERQALVRGHGPSEEQLVAEIMHEMELEPLDIHKGVKSLWRTKFMDCHYAKYRKSKSAAIEIVDKNERYGIRENDEELFKLLMRSVILNSSFVIESEEVGVSKIAIEPSQGRLAVLQYSANGRAVEDVVRKILQNN
jgi:hypothetical protein